jgi:PAS domain S-box-containing protein
VTLHEVAEADASDASDPPPSDDHHFSSFVGAFLVDSLHREGGDQLVETVLREAGEVRTAEQLRDPMEWSSYHQARRLFEATRLVTGNRARMSQVAREAAIGPAGAVYREMLHKIGSTEALLARIDELRWAVSTLTHADAEEVGPCDWRVTSRLNPDFEPLPDYCWLVHGLLSSLPQFFGLNPAQVVEEACQCEGADACTYRVTWIEDHVVDEATDRSEFLSEMLASRLDELQRIVAELVSDDDLETILTKIVASAGRTVRVPAYVLALETLPTATRRVYAEGLDSSEAERLAERLLNGDDTGGARVLVSEIRSARRSYGLLAAVDPTGTRNFMDEERSVLDAYALLAAAALEVAGSLEEARLETRAAEAMGDMLADERSLLSAIVEAMPHGVCWVSSSGEIQGCNQTLVDLFGYASIDQVQGRYWRDVVRGDAAVEQIEAWWTKVSEGEPVINQEFTYGPVHDRRVVMVSVVPLVSVSGESGVLSLWADMTTQRSLEQRLAEASRLESIGQLAAGMAHEINTPMQYINNNGAFLGKGFGSLSSLVDDLLELAADGGADPAVIERLTSGAKLDLLRTRVPEAVTQVCDGVDAVSHIVSSLKTFAHPNTDRFEGVDLGLALDATVTVTHPEWEPVAELDLDLGDDLPLVRAVPGMINQVLLNLIVNAAHAIDDRRRAEATDELGRIGITCRLVGDLIEVAVTDDGGGIPDEVRHKIYDQFYTTKPVGKGTGQGLAACRNIVIRHEGTIDFTTSPAGTTFTIQLPVWKPVSE